MNKAKLIKRVIVIFLLVTAISVLLVYLQNRIGLERIREVIIGAGFWGPLVYIFLHLLTHIIAPIQGSPLMILAIGIFGKWAFIFTYIVNILSSFTNFWIARKLGRDIVVKFVGKEGMEKIDHIAEHEGIKALVIMRFFQGFISDFVSYAAGLTSMKFKPYILVSILVPLPWAIITFFFFNLVPQEQAFFWTLIGGALFFVIPPVYYYLKHKFFENRIVHKK